MKIRKPLLGVLAGVLTLACVARAADAPNLPFKFKTIDVPNALQTSTYGINNVLQPPACKEPYATEPTVRA
jgi:hypothetical protein